MLCKIYAISGVTVRKCPHNFVFFACMVKIDHTSFFSPKSVLFPSDIYIFVLTEPPAL